MSTGGNDSGMNGKRKIVFETASGRPNAPAPAAIAAARMERVAQMASAGLSDGPQIVPETDKENERPVKRHKSRDNNNATDRLTTAAASGSLFTTPVLSALLAATGASAHSSGAGAAGGAGDGPHVNQQSANLTDKTAVPVADVPVSAGQSSAANEQPGADDEYEDQFEDSFLDDPALDTSFLTSGETKSPYFPDEPAGDQ